MNPPGSSIRFESEDEWVPVEYLEVCDLRAVDMDDALLDHQLSMYPLLNLGSGTALVILVLRLGAYGSLLTRDEVITRSGRPEAFVPLTEAGYAGDLSLELVEEVAMVKPIRSPPAPFGDLVQQESLE